MDTTFLETFLIAVDCGSVSEAARRLNLTAAGVAKRIRAVEGDIGTELVARSGRTIKATAAGSAIVDRARRLLAEAHHLRSIALNDLPSGQLRLGAFETALAGFLPDILAAMSERYPQIEVHITRGYTGELYPKVLDGGLDLAIIAQPSFALSKSCDWRLLREEPFIVLTRAPAASRDPHSILASEPFIRLDRKIPTGRLVDRYLRNARIRPRERFEIASIHAIAVMVDRGLGVSLLPDWPPPWPEGLSLAKVPVLGHPVGRRVGIVWARASPRIRLVEVFVEQATAHARLPARKALSKVPAR